MGIDNDGKRRKGREDSFASYTQTCKYARWEIDLALTSITQCVPECVQEIDSGTSTARLRLHPPILASAPSF
jgi:hypothetical protein